MQIRLMTAEDVPRVAELVEEFHSETVNSFGLDTDEAKMQSISSQFVGTSFVMLDDNEIVGALVGFVTSYAASAQRIYQEVMWYVAKEYRRSGAELLDHLELWCQEQNIDFVVMANLGEYRGEVFRRFYLRRGYKTAETHYIKKLSGV